MQLANFAAKCPYEIGDKVVFEGRVKEISDITCTLYLRSGHIEFRYELNGGCRYLPETDIKRFGTTTTVGGRDEQCSTTAD